jgi:hypothetical protein
MSVISVYPSVSPYIGNPAVDQARRDNLKRDMIEPVASAERGQAEKGVISEDKSRNHSAQTGLTYSDESKNRGTELKQAVEGRQPQGEDSGQSQSGQQGEGAEQRGQQSKGSEAELAAEQAMIAELKQRDAEVKIHEQAHASVGGQLAGSPSYTFQTGPDGKKYAIGGEVQIDVSVVPDDPQATIAKMQQVKAAALAPAQPSGADRQIAAEASRNISEAQAELARAALQSESEPAATADTTDEPELSFNEITGRLELPLTELLPASELVKPDAEAELASMMTGSDGNSRAMPQSESRTLAVNPEMQQRTDVIAGFYARATQPSQRPLLQMI